MRHTKAALLSLLTGFGAALSVAQAGESPGSSATLIRQHEEVSALVAAAESSRTSAKDRLVRDAGALYRLSRSGMRPMAGGVDSILAHASRLARMRRLVMAELAAVKRCEEEIAAARRRMEQLEHDLASARRARASRGYPASLPAAQARRPVRQANERAGSRIPYGLSVVGGAAQEAFTRKRGRLTTPVSGQTTIRDAVDAAGALTQGLELQASIGASVRAVAPGRVVFAADDAQHGRAVAIDHGDRYQTVYGRLDRIYVSVGDEVGTGATVGVAGPDPVYFEVRRGDRVERARSWLGL